VRPADGAARLALGDTLAELGELLPALAEYGTAAALAPEDTACRQRMALIRERIDGLARAADRYAAALAAGAAPGMVDSAAIDRAAGGARHYLVSFASAEFAPFQVYLNQTAVAFGGIDGIVPWGPERLAATAFHDRHRDILSAPTGSGYWLWKPYIILELLERVREGDWVIYSDSGRYRPSALYRPIAPLLRWAAANGGLFPGIYVPEHGPNSRWTKRDCFVRMGCDAPRFWAAPQVQASFSLWRRSPAALDFVRRWLGRCTDRAIISDEPNIAGLPNLPGFVAHRHDQSVLTNLMLLRDVRAFGSPERPIAPGERLKSLDFAAGLAAAGA
jgi:hypothetical protein